MSENVYNKKLIKQTFYTFFVNGIMALMIGSIMTFITQDYKINYAIAGTLLSLHSMGNLFASFVAVYMIKMFGRKKSIIFLSSLLVISYLGIIFFDNVCILYIMFFITGLGRGSISNVDNAIINDIATGKSSLLNLLHTFFAFGAFLTPIIASVITGYGYSWKIVLGIGVLFSISMVITYCFMDIDDLSIVKSKNYNDKNLYYKNIDFYFASLLLFFYLGVENCVNGWIVTYLKDTGIMSTSYAQRLLSLIWVVIIFGRLLTAYLSEKKIKKETLILFNSIGAAVFFFVLINSTNIIVITLSITLFGFFIAGIYPTTVSSVGKIINGSASAMAVLLAFAGVGGIILPWLVGIAAQLKSIAWGMSFITADMIIVLIFAIIIRVRVK